MRRIFGLAGWGLSFALAWPGCWGWATAGEPSQAVPEPASPQAAPASAESSPAALEREIRRLLASGERPTAATMLSDQAGPLVARTLLEANDTQLTAAVRLAGWLGEPAAIAPTQRLLEARRIDRFTGVQTLVALHSPDALRRAVELFADDPAFGGPLVSSFRESSGSSLARKFLEADAPRGWRPAISVLSHSRDYNEMSFLLARSAELPPLRREDHALINVAVRRLRIEQRDIRAEALWEYLEDDRPPVSRDERLWILRELGELQDRAAVERLRESPWKERSLRDDEEAAVILWARRHGSDPLSPAETNHLRRLRHWLNWIPGATRWPP